MYLFTIEASPTLSVDNPNNSAGAYVNVWVDFPNEKAAELVARYFISDAGWEDKEMRETPKWMERDGLNEQQLQYYTEATEDGACLVFHTYPNEEA